MHKLFCVYLIGRYLPLKVVLVMVTDKNIKEYYKSVLLGA